MPIPKFPELEEQILKDWEAQDIFKKTLAKPSPKGDFVFYDGPPTANGIPHIGHVETRAFKDIIPRFKTMQGYRVERKAGWDTHGLPVEIEVEKELGISGKKDIEKYGIERFNAQAKASVWKYKDLWEKMTRRVGFWLDLEHPYITYQPEYIETLWWIFRQIWDQKLLVQDYKVVPYCPRCGTALSSHEVAQGYERITEPAAYVKFELVDEPRTFVLAWTTTPWTLPGNVALAVDPKIRYARVRRGDEYYILAENRMPDLGFRKEQVAKTVSGAALVGKKYKPLFDFLDLREVGKSRIPERSPRRSEGSLEPTGLTAPEILRRWAQEYEHAYSIVPADFVTTDEGTGVVHTAVMYGEDDFQLGKKLDLPTIHTVDLQGKFDELVKPWAGLEVRDAKGQTQKKIVDWLEKHHKLYKIENYTHDYPFCWRCKHPLLYYAKTSWFIQMSKLRDQLIANNNKINWHPAHIKAGRFGEWLREVKDWAVSRERFWGTPLPIWRCDQCGHQECLGSYQDLLDRLPTRNRYFFVRHGGSTNNENNTLNTEPANKNLCPLTESGRKQAQRGAQKLEPEKIDAIYSSQFLRARQTAEIIGQELGIAVTEDKRINEYHIGPVFEGKTIAEFHATFGDRSKRVHDAPPGGETWTDIRQRMLSFLRELDAKHEGKTFVIVTHADPILVTEWALSLQPAPTITRLEDVPNGRPIELKFPATVFQSDGSFDPHRPFIDGLAWSCPQCHHGTMKRVPEVADAWFDSGAMPFAQWHYPFEHKNQIDGAGSYPAHYISEAIDQTRGWFYTLLAISTLLQRAGAVKESSYRHVLVLGHLNDTQGRKLSKSLKNYGDLDELFAKHGADALRWFMYTANQPWDTKNFDPKIVGEGVKKTFLILMNVVSFWQLYESTNKNYEPTNRSYESTNVGRANHPLDRWVHSMVNVLTKDVTKRLEHYDITGAARAIGAFVTDLSTWYVRRSRDRFKSDEMQVASVVLQHVLRKLSKLMAPFIPFLAEHVYHVVGGDKESVHLEDWPSVGEIDARLLSDMALAKQIVEQGHALRAKAGLKVRQPLAQLVMTAALRPDLDSIVREELNVKEIHVAESLPSGKEWMSSDRVALDTTVSDELKEEGMVRDLVREINALRKTAGLKPADQIVLYVQPKTLAGQVVERYAQRILPEVRAKTASPSLDGVSHKTTIELDGKKADIGLARA
ncbi:MAG: class I tRNA ligase family protein [Candidatus Kerfeldbacteria bacterium]|nr:class I tRNA ligase family protein [Candidatus Kerfeldbacteria bacterium]